MNFEALYVGVSCLKKSSLLSHHIILKNNKILTLTNHYLSHIFSYHISFPIW
jgi:hypothetical protein